jgi:hypothetical protein
VSEIELSELERKWINRKWELIRTSQRKADEANNEWNRINDEINDKHRRESLRRMQTGQFPLTDLMKATDKSASLPLQDALATGNWHSRNAERHIQDVMLFLKLKELGIR